MLCALLVDHKNHDGHKNLQGYKNGIVSFNIQLNAGIILRNSQVFAINFHRLLYYISQRQSNAFDFYYYYYVACLSVAGLLVWCIASTLSLRTDISCRNNSSCYLLAQPFRVHPSIHPSLRPGHSSQKRNARLSSHCPVPSHHLHYYYYPLGQARMPNGSGHSIVDAHQLIIMAKK